MKLTYIDLLSHVDTDDQENRYKIKRIARGRGSMLKTFVVLCYFLLVLGGRRIASLFLPARERRLVNVDGLKVEVGLRESGGIVVYKVCGKCI
jgi:hypothetical protein